MDPPQFRSSRTQDFSYPGNTQACENSLKGRTIGFVFGFEAGCQRYLSHVSSLRGSFSHETTMTQGRGANHIFHIWDDSYARRCSRTRVVATPITSSPLPHITLESPVCTGLVPLYIDIHAFTWMYILPRGPCPVFSIRAARAEQEVCDCMRGSRSL